MNEMMKQYVHGSFCPFLINACKKRDCAMFTSTEECAFLSHSKWLAEVSISLVELTALLKEK